MTASSAGLRDPIWQAIGVFVAVVTLVVTILITNSDKRSIVAVIASSIPLNEYLPNENFSIIDKQSKKDVGAVVVVYLVVMNRGNKAIRSSDLAEPLSLIAPNLSVLSISKCPDAFTIENINFNLSLEWKARNDAWTADIPLLNPGDVSCNALFLKVSELQSAGPLTIGVNARIADARFVFFPSWIDYLKSINNLVDSPYQVYVELDGWRIPIFLFFQSVLFAATYAPARVAGMFDKSGLKSYIGLTLGLLLATSSAEILTAVSVSSSILHVISWPLLAIHGICETALIVVALRATRPAKAEDGASKESP